MGGFFFPSTARQPSGGFSFTLHLPGRFTQRDFAPLSASIAPLCKPPKTHCASCKPSDIAFSANQTGKTQRKNPPEQCSWRGGVVCLCRRMCFENANIIPKATRLCKQKKHLTRKSASEPSGESLRRHVLRRAPSLPSPHVHPPPRCSTTLRQHPKAFPLQNVLRLKHVFPIKIPKKKSSATTVRLPKNGDSAPFNRTSAHSRETPPMLCIHCRRH